MCQLKNTESRLGTDGWGGGGAWVGLVTVTCLSCSLHINQKRRDAKTICIFRFLLSLWMVVNGEAGW